MDGGKEARASELGCCTLQPLTTEDTEVRGGTGKRGAVPFFIYRCTI